MLGELLKLMQHIVRIYCIAAAVIAAAAMTFCAAQTIFALFYACMQLFGVIT
jgi:hypothetical protein